MARRLDVKPLRIEKNKNGHEKNPSSTMLEEWKEFTLPIQITMSTKKFSRMWRETGKTYGSNLAVSKTIEHHERDPHPIKCAKTMYSCIVESHESRRQKSRIFAAQKTMKITLQVKELLLWHITTWCTNSSRCHKQWKLESIGELPEVCSNIILKKTCNWHGLDDLTLCGRSTSLRDRSQQGPEHVTNV